MNFFTLTICRLGGVLIVLLFICSPPAGAQNPSPPDFVKPCQGDGANSTRIISSILINGVNAVPGEDYVALYDSEGYVIGTGPITSAVFGNCPTPRTGINFSVFGVNGTLTPDETCPVNFGGEVGETLTGLVYDGSENTYYNLPGNLTFRTAPPILPSGGSCNTVDASAVVLPATLIAFRGEALEPKIVRLSWDVAQEDNVSHYEVLRSRNGRDWETLDEVTAVGQSNTPLNYEFFDRNPAFNRHFYRLNILDNDGSSELSGIVIVDLEVSGDRTVSVYPNPASATTRLGIQLGGEWSEGQAISGQLIDLSGRLLATYANLRGGGNSITLPAGIAEGLYLLRVTQADRIFTTKVSLR